MAIPSRKHNLTEFTKHSYTFGKTQIKNNSRNVDIPSRKRTVITSYQVHLKDCKIWIKTPKMAIPPRKRLVIINVAIFSRRRDFKEFTKILSRKRASLYLTINNFSKKLKNLNQSTKNSKLNLRYTFKTFFKTASIRSLRNPTFYL